MSDPALAMATEAATSLQEVIRVAPTVAVLVLVILGGAVAFRWLIGQCEKREQRAIENWAQASERSIAALKSLEVVIARLEAKLGR